MSSSQTTPRSGCRQYVVATNGRTHASCAGALRSSACGDPLDHHVVEPHGRRLGVRVANHNREIEVVHPTGQEPHPKSPPFAARRRLGRLGPHADSKYLERVDSVMGRWGPVHSRGVVPAASHFEGVPDVLDVASIHESHADFVWCSLQRLGVRPADLEDALQEVFVVVHRKLSSFDGSSRLSTWLFGISMRVASAYRRKAH